VKKKVLSLKRGRAINDSNIPVAAEHGPVASEGRHKTFESSRMVSCESTAWREVII
jgi:hypothetical protein